MSEQAMVQVSAETAENLKLVALTPSDLATAQADLGAWCTAKIGELSAEHRDLTENIEVAKRSKWRSGALVGAAGRVRQRIVFYEKLKMAVDAGYLVVPNFPVDVFAVRTARKTPDSTVEAAARYLAAQRPQLLMAGEGRYVSPRPASGHSSHEEKQKDGTTKIVEEWWASAFKEPEFPVAVVRPVILDATQRAMGLNLFDRIGVIQEAKKRDPIVVGQILDPRGGSKWSERPVSFFIAWWLDTRTL